MGRRKKGGFDLTSRTEVRFRFKAGLYLSEPGSPP